MDVHEKKLKLDDEELITLLGYNEDFLGIIDNRFNSVITIRGNYLIIKGDLDEIRIIENIFRELSYIIKRNGDLKRNDLISVIEVLDEQTSKPKKIKMDHNNNIVFLGIRDAVRARTKKQIEYVNKVKNHDLVFAVGPAGTGKTFLAVAMALEALKDNRISKIIISRPAVEAGESLGFLPGDLAEKLDPYLRPLTDALYYMIGSDKLKSMMEKNVIEIIPLAYMRGRTLNNAFIILDEAQNATITQMKMFLTRMGANAQAIVTGDITQIDLREKHNSGLLDAVNILKRIQGISFVFFTKKDVVRHKLVARIINAYEKNGKNSRSENNKV
jgi:phosphate starvation-inducible protein PhoH and related proteins